MHAHIYQGMESPPFLIPKKHSCTSEDREALLDLRSGHLALAELSFFYGPTLTSIHDYWKNLSSDYMDFCQQSDASTF